MPELTDVLRKEHKAAEKCHKDLNNPGNRKVRGKCHYISLYRGAANNNCNLKHQTPDHMHILVHNLSGDDTHLFMKKVKKKLSGMILVSLLKTGTSILALVLSITSSWQW